MIHVDSPGGGGPGVFDVHPLKHDAPLDANFFGGGRCVTDADGRYRFMSVKPGAYPWGNHHNAWRPGHIHLSLFGPSFLTRLVTQMFFPGDPLLPIDPIFNSIPDEKSRHLLVANFSLDATQPNFALGYQFDITLRGRNAHHIAETMFKATARALAMAVAIDPRVTGVPSTKGSL